MTSRSALLAIALLSVFCVALGRAEEPAKPALVSEGVWVMRYDDKLDGEVRAKPGGEVRWRLAVRNDRVAGSLAGLKDGDPTDHRLAGDVVAGRPPLVSARQDGPGGLTCYYTGRLVGADRIVGTWYDNRGGSGDFEMTPEKK